MTGAALGGVGLMLLPVLQSTNPSVAGVIFVVIGFGAVALGRDPNGLANLLFGLGPWVSAGSCRDPRRALPGLPARPAATDDEAPTATSTTASNRRWSADVAACRLTTSSSSSAA